MKSIYRRQFIQMAGMILLSFALLGASFMALSYRFMLRDKQHTMERNASYIAAYAGSALSQGIDLRSDGFLSYISSAAMLSDAYVIFSGVDGAVISAANRGASPALTSSQLPAWAVNRVLTDGSYAGTSSLSGLFAENRHVVGVPIVAQVRTVSAAGMRTETITGGLLFVAADISSLTQLWRTFGTLFFFSAVVVLLIAFVTSSVTSLRLARPLQEMADATYKFAHGEFDVRVAGYEDRHDEIGELAAGFNNMAAALAKSEGRRSEFVANISHELKTPMTTIAGFADGILDGTIPQERVPDSLRTISSETRRLSRLVRRMLDLSRLQSAEHVTAQEPFDISEVLLRVLVSLERKINARTLDVDAQLPDGPVAVWGDPDAITQVCYNLLDNAIKFALPQSAIAVSIVCKGTKARVTVRNEGDPIPPEQLPLIFDRFHKTDSSRSEDRDGVGLGLYIVKTILNNHKEDITVTSEGGYTAFTFTLTLV